MTWTLSARTSSNSSGGWRADSPRRGVHLDVIEAFRLQVARMHAAHGAPVAVQQVLAVCRQLRHLLVELIERDFQDLVVGERQRRPLFLGRVAHVDDYVVYRRGLYQFHFFRSHHAVQQLADLGVLAVGNGISQYLRVYVSFFLLHPVQLGAGDRFAGNHATVFRHVAGEGLGADVPGNADDFLLVHGDQRPQYHFIAGAIDHVQVGQGLARHLGHGIAHHQAGGSVVPGDVGRDFQHHALEYHAPVAMVYRAHDLRHHAFERHGDKLHVVGGAIALPQVVHHLAHAHLMGGATQVEKQEMAANTAAHHQVGSYRRIVASGDQRHHGFYGTQRVTTHALMATVGNVELVVFDLNAHLHVRFFQVYAPGIGCHEQRSAYRAFQVKGAEIVLAVAP